MLGRNPIIYGDYPDPDVVRAEGAYYMISTSMHMFPGAQILRSCDLMHWEHCSYVYDRLGETARQRMEGEGKPDYDGKPMPANIYGKGMWAGSIKHHDGLFHVIFTSNDTGHSYHFTAEHAEGPWERQPMQGFWYDPGLFFDDDGRVYVAHGNRTIRITELTADLSDRLEGGFDRIVVQDAPETMLGWEGSHMVKHDGWYYLFCIHWKRGGLRSMGCFRTRALTEAFEGGQFMELPLEGRGDGVAQGGPVQLPDGSWALLMFQDHGAVGRIPVVVPFRWEEGWPVVDSVPVALELPSFCPEHEYAPLYTSDTLRDGWSVLWQWNHEPHEELIDSDGDGLHITTDRLADNCTAAVNTLTQRCFGPACTAEVTVDGSGLKVGDRAGLCALQGCFSELALERTAEGFVLVRQVRRDSKAPYAIAPATEPVEALERIPAGGGCVRMRAAFDFRRDTVQMYYEADGAWQAAGQPHQLVYRLDHFMGCRIGLFVYSTAEAGGTACFRDFDYHVEEE